MPFAASSYKGKISCLTGHDMQCNSSVIVEDVLDVTVLHVQIDDVTLILMQRRGNCSSDCMLLGGQSLQLTPVQAST